MADESTTTGATDTATGDAGTTTSTEGTQPNAAPETLLTGKPAGEGTADGTTGKEGTDQGSKVSGAPEKYELKAPEGVTLDPALMTGYEALFKEANLSNELAQKLIDHHSSIIKQQTEAANTALVKQHDEWVSAVKADAEIGGVKLDENVKHAQSFLAKYGSDSLKQFLKDSGAGSHPELVRIFAKAGRAMAEDVIVTGKSAPAEKDVARQIFPSMSK